MSRVGEQVIAGGRVWTRVNQSQHLAPTQRWVSVDSRGRQVRARLRSLRRFSDFTWLGLPGRPAEPTFDRATASGVNVDAR